MSNEIIRVSDRSVKLCCNKRNCPIMEDMGNGMVKIIDDDGNHVIMKKEQAALMADGVKTLNEEKLLLG